MTMHPSILLIDDSPGERELFRLALAQTRLAVTLHTEQDADDAFRFLDHLATHAPKCSPGEVTGVVSTARVERGESATARSASTETMPVTSPSLPRARVAQAQDHAGVVHSMPFASTETMPAASQSSISLQEGGLNRSPTARNIPPSQPSARQDALFPERGEPATARCASKGDRSGLPHSLPSLILLDLNLRSQNGCDLLKRLRSDPRFATIPILIFTTSDEPVDLAHSYSCGANGYVVKPGTFDELVHCTGDLCRYWLTWNRLSMSDTAC